MAFKLKGFNPGENTGMSNRERRITDRMNKAEKAGTEASKVGNYKKRDRKWEKADKLQEKLNNIKEKRINKIRKNSNLVFSDISGEQYLIDETPMKKNGNEDNKKVVQDTVKSLADQIKDLNKDIKMLLGKGTPSDDARIISLRNEINRLQSKLNKNKKFY